MAAFTLSCREPRVRVKVQTSRVLILAMDQNMQIKTEYAKYEKIKAIKHHFTFSCLVCSIWLGNQNCQSAISGWGI